MDKYEYRLKAEQIEKLVKKRDYDTAAKIADTIDWRRVKNLNMLYTVGEVYENTERYEDCMAVLNIAYDKAPVGRMLLYKMTDIATRMHDFDEAISLYREFVRMAPHDQSRYLLKYQIYRERGSSVEDQITILSEYKTHEYQEKWAYELASLYAEAGMQEECVRECDELILWFSEGEYVIKALELKMQFEPLTAAQQEKYDRRPGAAGSRSRTVDFENTEVPEFNSDKFSTLNLQAELAANLDELFQEDTDNQATIEIPVLDSDLPVKEAVQENREQEIHMEELEIPDLEFPEPESEVTEEILKLQEPDLEPSEEILEFPELDLELPEETQELREPEPESETVLTVPEAVEEIPGTTSEEEPEPAEEEQLPEDTEHLSGLEILEPEESIPETEDMDLLLELEVPEVETLENGVLKAEAPEVKVVEAEIPDEEPEEESFILEELMLPDEGSEEAEDPEPAAEISVPQLSAEEEEPVEKQITGQLSIDDILAEWENKKAETEAILEADAQQAQVRREKVKQETAELMKLISGISDAIPEDVQQIMEEIDGESHPEPEVLITADDLPQDLDEPDEEEDEGPALEELSAVVSHAPVKQEKPGGDTMSMNMIQELERSLSTETSDMAVNAGHLTREQASLFAYFTSVKGMSGQLSVLLKGESRKGQTNSSSGNMVITGEQGNGKTTLAIDIVKVLQKQKQIQGKQLAKISGKKLNKKDIHEILTRLKGGALIIERAGGLSGASMMALSLGMEADTGGLLVILEDTAEEIQKLFLKNSNFASKFDYTVDIPVFTNDELVAFGKSYALEQEYSFDEFGVLALYDRIGSRQTNDHLVTVAEVKEIIDNAIEHAEKGSLRHLFEKVTKKTVDESGNHLLREDDFER